MLKGGNPDKLKTLKAQSEAALKQLQAQYAQAMGLGEKKPKSQIKSDFKENDTDHTHPTEYDAFGTTSRNNSFSGMDSLLPEIRYLGAPNGAVYKSEAVSLPNEIIYAGLPVAR
jgi:hypothetical protein